MIELLVSAGAEVDRPGGETWRGDVPLRTPYQHAVLRGKDELAKLLAGLGASTDVDPADAGVASIARGERPTEPLPETLDPDAQEVIVLTALRGKLDLVVDIVGPSFRGVVGGSPEGTLLHHAAWIGSPELVERLLAARRRSGRTVGRPSATRRSRGRCTGHSTTTCRIATSSGWQSAWSRPARRSSRSFSQFADGPLAEWLQRMSIASPNE